jgi:hypothetical protein
MLRISCRQIFAQAFPARELVEHLSGISLACDSKSFRRVIAMKVRFTRYSRNFTAALALMIGCSNVAVAAPQQLYGKSVFLRWTEDLDVTDVDGHSKHVANSLAVGWYTSSQGRVFVQAGISGISRKGFAGGSRARMGAGWSRDPTGGVIKTGNVRYPPGSRHWQGHTLTVVKVFESGARQMVINFDDSFQSCTLNITYGKEHDMPGVISRGMNTRLYVSKTIKVSSTECKVTDGNMFGDQAE